MKFKNLFLLLLAVSLLLSLCACGKTAEAPAKAEAEEKAPVFTYDLTDTQELIVEGECFDGDVEIIGENGLLRFMNCEFKGSIINKGGEGARVFLWEDCTLSASTRAYLSSGLKEATLDTNLPKFMFFCAPPEVICENAGAVVTPAGQTVTLNGADYSVENAQFYVNELTGEFSEFTSQEAAMQNIAMWYENGELVQMHVAVAPEG